MAIASWYGLFAGDFRQRLLNSVYMHCRNVSGKYSRGSYANNHLIGEAAGVYIAASYFTMLADAAARQQNSKSVLEREIQAQTFADGCTKEHAFSYQFFVWQFYLFTSLVGQWQQDNFSAVYSLTLSRVGQFITAVAQGGSAYPMLGDPDDGYVLDLGDHVHDINAFVILRLIFMMSQYLLKVINSLLNLPSGCSATAFHCVIRCCRKCDIGAAALCRFRVLFAPGRLKGR